MNDFQLDKTYVMNLAYKFRPDVDRIILTNEDSGVFNSFDPESIKNSLTGFTWVLHPLLVYIFSHFDGESNLQEIIEELSNVSGISEDMLIDGIKKFIYNSDTFHFDIPLKNSTDNSIFNQGFALPKNFLIEKPDNYKYRDLLKGIDFMKISKHIDFTTRLNIPNEVTVMTTDKCLTDCVYCYANRSKKIKNEDLLSYTRITELIDEARHLNVRNFEISGGDFFMYDYWYEVTKKLLSNNYMPYISTKVPINEIDIKKLKTLGVNKIQFSLDSVNKKELKTLLKVQDSYFEKVKKTFELLEKNNIELYVKSVITKYNDSLVSVQNLLNFLTSFKNITKISIAPGEYSNYKPFTYASDSKKLEIIRGFIESVDKDFKNISIEMQGYQKLSEIDNNFEVKKSRFKNRSLCSGNTTSFYVLPDGTATICEQVYWHPKLKLGNVKENSIIKVWNSEKAKGLYNIKQEEIQQNSPCFTCDEFESCRRGLGVCWRDAFFTYGDENFDYPSPNCPYAPQAFKNTYIK